MVVDDFCQSMTSYKFYKYEIDIFLKVVVKSLQSRDENTLNKVSQNEKILENLGFNKKFEIETTSSD